MAIDFAIYTNTAADDALQLHFIINDAVVDTFTDDIFLDSGYSIESFGDFLRYLYFIQTVGFSFSLNGSDIDFSNFKSVFEKLKESERGSYYIVAIFSNDEGEEYRIVESDKIVDYSISNDLNVDIRMTCI